jgi:hypothetical protein
LGAPHKSHGATGNFAPGWHEWTYIYDDGCDTTYKTHKFCANSAPTATGGIYVHPPQNVSLKQIVPTAPYFNDYDLPNDKLTYSFVGTGWPTWLKLDSETGEIKGIHDTAGTWDVTIVATDRCLGTITKTVRLTYIPELPPTVQTNPATLFLKTNSTFHHTLEPRIFFDPEHATNMAAGIITTVATL